MRIGIDGLGRMGRLFLHTAWGDAALVDLSRTTAGRERRRTADATIPG